MRIDPTYYIGFLFIPYDLSHILVEQDMGEISLRREKNPWDMIEDVSTDFVSYVTCYLCDPEISAN